MKIVIYTLGCKVNKYESDALLYALSKLGHQVSEKLEYADIYILNTCAVTNEAERKSRQMISKFKELNPNSKILVCGCASEKNAEQFKNLPNVTYVIGTYNKLSLISNLDSNGVNIEKSKTIYESNYKTTTQNARAYVKIQDGCNNFCTYCIIPYLRGRSRSRDVFSIITEIDELAGQVKEIVLTGINLTDFKIDDELAIDKLLIDLVPYTDRVRFRLGSLEQAIVEQKFIDAMKQVNLCPHFHLSLQSGSDSVLKRMNRHYRAKEFMNSIKLLRKNFVNPAITTDVIVGFPEETDKEFKQTVRFIKKAKFFNLHIFPYSNRTGTVASKLPQIDGNIKRKRVKILEKLNKKLNNNYIKKSRKYEYNLLVEEYDGEYFVGHTENYIKCYIKGDYVPGEIVKIKITKPFKDGALSHCV